MLTAKDIITYRIAQEDVLSVPVKSLADKTANTWQADRSDKEKVDDTLIGKVAELAFERYLADNGVAYISWDQIRQDGLAKHAPLDGFVMEKALEGIARNRLFIYSANQAQRPVYFDTEFRDICEENQIYGCEVKGTRIGDRLCHFDGSINYEKMLEDHFFQYPVSTRFGEITPELRTRLLGAAEKEKTAQKTPRLLVRVYVDRQPNMFVCYLVGYISRDKFFDSPDLDVAHLFKAGKSESAIFYTVKQRYGYPLSQVIEWLTRNTHTGNCEGDRKEHCFHYSPDVVEDIEGCERYICCHCGHVEFWPINHEICGPYAPHFPMEENHV